MIFQTWLLILRVDKTTLVYILFKSLRDTLDERELKIGYFVYVHSFIYLLGPLLGKYV